MRFWARRKKRGRGEVTRPRDYILTFTTINPSLRFDRKWNDKYAARVFVVIYAHTGEAAGRGNVSE